MCVSLVVDGQEVDTPAGMASMLGCSVGDLTVARGWPDVIADACLCQVDVETTLGVKGISWTWDERAAVYTLHAIQEAGDA